MVGKWVSILYIITWNDNTVSVPMFKCTAVRDNPLYLYVHAMCIHFSYTYEFWHYSKHANRGNANSSFFSSKKKKKVTVKVRKHSNSNKGASPIRVHNALNSGRSSLDIYWSQTKNLSTRERCLNLKFRENIDNNKWPPFHWLIHSYRRRRKKEKRTHIQTRRKFNLIKSIKCHLDTWIIYIYWMLQCELLNVKRNGIVCSERRYWKLGSATCIEQRHRK